MLTFTQLLKLITYFLRSGNQLLRQVLETAAT